MTQQTRINLSGIHAKLKKRGLDIGDEYPSGGTYHLLRDGVIVGHISFTKWGTPCIFPDCKPGKMYTSLRLSDEWR